MKIAIATVLLTFTLSLISGAVLWLNEIHGLARANSRELLSVREYTKQLETINTRLSRIEGAVGVKSE